MHAPGATERDGEMALALVLVARNDPLRATGASGRGTPPVSVPPEHELAHGLVETGQGRSSGS